MFNWFMKRKSLGTFDVDILDIEETNRLLSDAGYPNVELSTQELCRILNVDGLLSSKFSLSQPMSVEAVAALRFFLGGMAVPMKLTFL